MKTKHLVITIVAAALPIAGLVAEDTGNQPAAPKEEQKSDQTSKDQMCKASSQASNQLDQLVAAMNNATPDKKVDAIAAVVAKIVEQQKANSTRSDQMCTEGKSGMNMCQMMAGMDMKSGENDKSGGEHSHHH